MTCLLDCQWAELPIAETSANGYYHSPVTRDLGRLRMASLGWELRINRVMNGKVQMSRGRWAEVVSEVGGPAPLFTVMLLEVGLRSGAVLPTLLAAVTMGVLPYAVTVWLARAGKVSDRFVKDRRQRTPILLGTLVIFLSGAVALWAFGAPSELRAFVAVGTGGLLTVTVITLFWKVSVHATLAALFAGIQVVLFGAWGALGLAVLAGVLWARYHVRAHSISQLVAGTALGAGLAVCFAAASP